MIVHVQLIHEGFQVVASSSTKSIHTASCDNSRTHKVLRIYLAHRYLPVTAGPASDWLCHSRSSRVHAYIKKNLCLSYKILEFPLAIVLWVRPLSSYVAIVNEILPFHSTHLTVHSNSKMPILVDGNEGMPATKVQIGRGIM